MARSYNGQLVGSAAALGIKTYTVPGTRVRVALRPLAAPILLWIGTQLDKRVADVDVTAGHREPDDWGYAYRNTRGQNTWSNHASGTAVDYNATSWPRGVRRMSARQVAECRRIRDEVNRAAGKRLVDWGGDYVVAKVDQMHWELASGVTAADVTRAMRALASKPALKLAAKKPAVKKAAVVTVPTAPPLKELLEMKLTDKITIPADYQSNMTGKPEQVTVEVALRRIYDWAHVAAFGKKS
jgi:hypothetical protein